MMPHRGLSIHSNGRAEAGQASAIIMFCWFFGFFSVFGCWFPITIPLMVFSYLKIQSNEKWTISIILTVTAWLFFYFLFVRLLNLPFPDGLIFTWLDIKASHPTTLYNQPDE
jgi:hypothetical protein